MLEPPRSEGLRHRARGSRRPVIRSLPACIPEPGCAWCSGSPS